MRARLLALLLALSSGLSLASAQVTTRLIATGISRPIWAGAPTGDARVFVATKAGLVFVVENGVVLTTPFLDIRPLTSNGSEQGLLGMAFHPRYATNGFFYLNYTDLAGDTVVARYTVSAGDPNLADPASASVVLTVAQPFENHNAGDLHFGPDGYLYVFFGDGGLADDPGCRAQKLNNPLGKIWRIDIDSASPYGIPPDNPFVGVSMTRPEIFHYGLRNPWRSGFDRLTGDLYVGDVGQGEREEISVAPAGSMGLNFGWKMMEGTRCNQSSNCPVGTPVCNDPGLVQPIVELLHADRSFSVIGGYVYRGCACPSEYGKYFFADYYDAKIRSLEYDVVTGTVSNLTDRTADLAPGGGLSIRNVASFGEDGFGELLIVEDTAGGNGEVYRMVPAGAPAATNVVRNGSGVNRACLTSSSLPILGNLWQARVDTSAHPGATFVFLVGYAGPSAGTFSGANEILVDAASPFRFLLMRPASGASDVFQAPIPCSAALAGVPVSVQAAIFGGGLELCNALDVTPGYY